MLVFFRVVQMRVLVYGVVGGKQGINCSVGGVLQNLRQEDGGIARKIEDEKICGSACCQTYSPRALGEEEDCFGEKLDLPFFCFVDHIPV